MSEWRPEPGVGDPRLSAFEHALDPVLVTEGPGHRIVLGNAAGRSLLGSDAVGRNLAVALPSLTSDQLALWSSAREGRSAVRGHGVLPDGDAGATYALLLSPWHDASGEPHGVVAHLRRAQPRPVMAADPVGREPFVAARGLAADMQEAVLPRQLPVLPLADVAATYLLSGEDAGVGGDWLDAVRTPSDALALVVGDVVGGGVESVTTMGQLRAVLRERLRTGSSPADALRSADFLAADIPEAVAATACVVVLDPRTGRLAYCTAGHPPPLVVESGGVASYLPTTGGSALATGGEFHVHDHELRPGELLLLYTDGAVKRPARSTVQNTLELADLTGRAFVSLGGGHGIRGTVDEVCQRVLAELVSQTGSADDMALLAAERMPLPYPLDLRLPAVPDSVRRTRERLGAWLDDLEVRDLDATAVLHAVSEVVSNAVEHAYLERPVPKDAIEVTATLETAGQVVVVVRDRGSWRPGGSTGRGRGLTMARGFADGLRVDRSPAGTCVTLRHGVGRPIAMFRGVTARDQVRPAPRRIRTVPDGAGRVSVHGQVDQLAADDLREDLMHWTGGGTTSLVVDLSDVSFLGSTGVQLLAEAIGWTHEESVLELVATPGSPAQHVLEIVGLPYGAP